MKRKNTQKLAIVVLTCDKPELLINCLACLKKQQVPGVELFTIIVDNGSSKTNLKKINNNLKDAILITNMKNYGFAKGINHGIRLALNLDADYILTLNDDTQFSADFLQKLLDQVKLHQVPIAGPKIILPNGLIWSKGGEINTRHYSGTLIGYGQKNTPGISVQKVDFISGTALLVKKEVYSQIGLFNEDYFFYYDDVDFCTRARKAGYNSFLVPSVMLTHLENSTIGKNSPLHIYHSTLSHLIFLFKFAPLPTKIREYLRNFYYALFSANPYKSIQLKALLSFFTKGIVHL